MNTRPMHTKRLAATLCAAGLMLAAGALHAADATGRGSAQSQYQQDVAACKSGATGQDPAACMREAGAARQEAGRQNLKEGSTDQYQQNMIDRCNRLPAASRQDCVTQMTSPTNVRGSVQGGGVLRETVIQVPADSVLPASGATGVPGAAPAPAGGTMSSPIRQ
ncbi:hypothetical protein B9P52_26010 [Achromobacter denitrificans]|uniref:hypothetical protein n=1 Tax=Achromobacter denitrificans TaxID=32002 RepID=UPI000B4C2CA6|nr:hypothetical protein [Achromobacter denitrificans]ASC68994.1 hypothetical protein B9P52_26010 [Achromobacter denitrificans]